MDADYGTFMRRRRSILGLSQRQLAERSGVKQPVLAAIESGRRAPSDRTRHAVDRALTVRPSVAVAALRDEIGALFDQAGLPRPHVFGSVSRGSDDADSDIDFIVEFSEHHDIIDLLHLEHELQLLLTFPVDLVDARADGPVTESAASEAVAL